MEESTAPTARVIACVVTVAIGVFVVGGSALSLYFEVVGFGRPRDTGIRLAVVAPLLVGIAAGVIVPAGVCVWAAGGHRRSIAIVALVVAVLTAGLMVSLLGLG